jgi:hypothetical protein
VDLDIIVLENDPNALTGCSYSRRPFLGIVWYRIKSIFSKDF